MDELEQLTKEADELYKMLNEYKEKAEAFDKKWDDWEKKNINFSSGRSNVHPCHIIKKARDVYKHAQN